MIPTLRIQGTLKRTEEHTIDATMQAEPSPDPLAPQPTHESGPPGAVPHPRDFNDAVTDLVRALRLPDDAPDELRKEHEAFHCQLGQYLATRRRILGH
jgi:hypothetical protein